MLGFQRIFIFIRSQIRSSYNVSLLEKINTYSLLLIGKSEIRFDMFKIETISIVNGDTEIEDFFNKALNVDCSNYSINNLKEIMRYLYVLSDTALEICKQLKEGQFERAYDLVDAIHCLPEAILTKKNWNSKVFWNTYIRPYREKWDSDFLNIREKELVNHYSRLFWK